VPRIWRGDASATTAESGGLQAEGEETFAGTRGNDGDAPIPAVRGEIEWARLPDADLPVSFPYRDIVELQATTAGVGP
jgi:hypothetical protein